MNTINKMLRLTKCTLIMFVLLGIINAFAQTSDLKYPGTSWEKVYPASVGWSPEAFGKADEVARSIRTDSYMVIHNGVIVHEFGATSKSSNLYSVRKSVLSILMGIYSDKGVINIEKTLSDIGISDKDGLTDVEKKATVRDLLQARSGIYHRSAYEPPKLSAAHPARGTYKPGERFEYNNWDFNALGTIFKKLTNKSVFAALRNDLAVPLQFEDFTEFLDTRWVYERKLSQHPAYVIRLSSRDLARIGLLMARGGSWKDKRIVSEAWIRESTTSYSTASPRIGYGYLWWVGIGGWHFGQKFPDHIYSARGSYGQFLIVDPTHDLVVVHRVNTDKTSHGDVSSRKFGALLALILAAGPNLHVSR
jgi:CubicO group peptidase (beta-lactamase class C family)